MKTPSYAQCAANWQLWREYVDSDATMTDDEFNKMTIEQKIQLQIDAFGHETTFDNKNQSPYEIELTESGERKFKEFFDMYARNDVSKRRVLFDLLDVLFNRVVMNESLSYELSQQFTITERPEILILDASDVTILMTNAAP